MNNLIKRKKRSIQNKPNKQTKQIYIYIYIMSIYILLYIKKNPIHNNTIHTHNIHTHITVLHISSFYSFFIFFRFTSLFRRHPPVFFLSGRKKEIWRNTDYYKKNPIKPFQPLKSRFKHNFKDKEREKREWRELIIIIIINYYYYHHQSSPSSYYILLVRKPKTFIVQNQMQVHDRSFFRKVSQLVKETVATKQP